MLGEELGLRENAQRAFLGAFIHDMARVSDGRSPGHGPRAAETKLPLFLPLFNRYGIIPDSLNEIHEAVWFHSKKKKNGSEDALKHTMNILKDADMLDRVRSNDVDPDLLRYPQSNQLIPFAEELFRKTRNYSAYRPFKDYVEAARKIHPSHKPL
jgi:hypothetical protein